MHYWTYLFKHGANVSSMEIRVEAVFARYSAAIGGSYVIDSQKDLEDRGMTGRAFEDGLPVLYRIEDSVPDPEDRLSLPWLAVISWPYDGADDNGMPSAEDNLRMFQLQDLIEEELEGHSTLRHVYSRTGNHLKELVYYLRDRDQFLLRFNEVMADQPRYPIELRFFEDEDWEDFGELLQAFGRAE